MPTFTPSTGGNPAFDPSAESMPGGVEISWANIGPEVLFGLPHGYRLFRQNPDGKPINIASLAVQGNTARVSTIDSSAIAGETYRYIVQLTDANGAVRDHSEDIIVTFTPPQSAANSSTDQLVAALQTAFGTTPPGDGLPPGDPPPGGNPPPSGSGSFCASEEQVSSHTCNSLHPAVAFDPAGNIGIAWHDTRDGNFEIYFKQLPSRISAPQLELQEGFFFDPATGRPMNLNCVGFSSIRPLTGTGTDQQNATGAVLTQGGGRLSVTVSAQLVIFEAAIGAVDFITLGVGPGSSVSILSGQNAGKTLIVSKVLSPNVLQLNFVNGLRIDTDFIYSVSNSPSGGSSSGEVRLTCGRSSSLFPDVVADREGRFHVVYQDDATGNFELYYIQIFPDSAGQKKCNTGIPINLAGFSTVPPANSSQDAPPVFVETGDVGTFFAFGNRLLPDPRPVATGDVNARTGRHILFQDFYPGTGLWTGVSRAADRGVWDIQAEALGLTTEPDYLAPAGHPIVEENDFGTKFTFRNIGFLAQSPPDRSVKVSKIALPIKPKCLPPSSPATTGSVVPNIGPAPKKPVPPSFTDPVDLSGILTSPLARIDEDSPPRFVIEGDETGTVFTNILTDDGRGQLRRFVFECRRVESETPVFVLGQRRCEDEFCAVFPSPSTEAQQQSQAQYKIKLQIWKGSEYLADPSIVESAQMTSLLVSEREFSFNPGEDISTFLYKEGELIFEKGRFYFFVPIPVGDVQFFVDAVGGGNAVWSTNGDGLFDQYFVPFTIRPNSGLNVPIYYEGTLENPAITSSGISSEEVDGCDLPIGEEFSLDTLDDTNAADVVLSATANADAATGQGTAFAFSVCQESVLKKLTVNAVGPTDGDITSAIVAKIVETDANGSPLFDKEIAPPKHPVARLVDDIVELEFVFNSDLRPNTVYALCIYIEKISRPASLSIRLKRRGAVAPLASSLPGIIPGKSFIASGSIEPATTTSLQAVFSYPLPSRDPSGNTVLYQGSESFVFPAGETPNIGDAPVGSSSISLFGANLPLLMELQSGTKATLGIGNTSSVSVSAPPPAAIEGAYTIVPPLQLTSSNGDSVHPRLAIDKDDNIWLVFHSNRTGADEVYVAKYFGGCGQWSTATSGGIEFQITRAGNNGKKAEFPNVATDLAGEAHIVYHSTDTEDGQQDVFYVRTSGGRVFLRPERISSSPAEAMMPDVAVASQLGGAAQSQTGDDSDRIDVVWHDARYGQFEIMAAAKMNGKWESSAQGGSDLRITQAGGDSVFPRIASDSKGNSRAVYHDYRRGLDNPWVFMSTFVNSAKRWDSSGQGGVDLPVSPTGTRESLHADVAIDRTNSVMAVWHDTRFIDESPDQHEEIMASYCSRLDATIVHFSVIPSNLEAFVETAFEIVDCVSATPIQATNVPEVCLRVTSPGASFLRIANEDGEFSEWTQFKPNVDLDTMLMPWTLTSTNGMKEICVQVQDATTVGFPVCREIVLQSAPPTFKIEFFKDEGLTSPLSKCKDTPVAPEGEIFVRLTSSVPLISPPTFDVVNHGVHLVTNQETLAITGFTGVANTGTGSFAGQVVETDSGTAFSAYANRLFKGRFRTHKEDGLFHIDGLARLIPHGKDVRGQSF